MEPTRRLRAVPALLALGGIACGGDRSGSPTCGLALVVGPTLIQQQMLNLRAVLVEAPVGLPATLPARVAGRSDPADVVVGYESGRLIMGFQGAGFPSRPGYGLMVVDDTSQRAMGVLVYDADGPRDDYPRIGTIQGGETTIPLYGVLVNWSKVSNPRCPLLGPPTVPLDGER